MGKGAALCVALIVACSAPPAASAPEASPTATALRLETAATSAIPSAIPSAEPRAAATTPEPSASATPEPTPGPTPVATADRTATPTPVAASAPIVTRPGGGQGLGLFARPFAGEFRLINFFDHDLPQEFVDHNGTVLTFWGERLPATSSFDGHQGYDWDMPEGTPLFAASGGRVTMAGQITPFPCPILNNRVVGSLSVFIEHRVLSPDGEALVLRSRYSHLSRVDVEVGQQVDQGTQLGLSGNTGCSSAPHLHFEVYRLNQATNKYVTIDPFGWEGSGPDPWAAHPAGAESMWQWKNAPRLFKEVHQDANTPSGTASSAVTGARWMGYRDDINPNNEFVEVSVDPRYAPGGTVDLSGYTLKNNRGDTYSFPAGFIARRDQPVRVYTGAGQNTSTTLYWGRVSGVWDNAGDCARLVNPGGGAYTIRFTNITCPR